MSAPVDTTSIRPYAAIPSALNELVSAESALNMYPDLLGVGAQPAYLSATDANVKHAVEHMHAAFRLMNMAYHDQEDLKTQIFRLVVQLRELGVAPKIKTWLDDE